MIQTPPGVILLVDSNVERCEKMAFALGARSEFRVETARGLQEARSFLNNPYLLAVVCDEGYRGQDGTRLLQDIRAMLGLDRVAFILMTAAGSSGVRITGWTSDADAVLTHPTHAAELQACLQTCVRRREVQLELAAEFTRRSEDADRTQDLLLTGLEAVAPGAARRGERLATLSLRLARELQVPDELLDDLVRAARLHEIGRFVVNAKNAGSNQASPAVLAASAALLQTLPALEMASELIGGMGANWDGSGALTHLEHGGIPMRSRILRVISDYYAHLGADTTALVGEASAAACEALALHNGTFYDAAVVSELALVVSTGYGQLQGYSVEPLRVEQLTEGRMLVNDLCTASGVKLLSAGAVLTPASLRLITERHALDPIVHAVATRRAGA